MSSYFRLGAQKLIMAIDNWMRIRMKVLPLPESPYGLIHVNYMIYRGQDVRLPDDVVIKDGDWIGELHFSNIGISSGKLGDTVFSSELQLLRITRSELILLSKLIKEEKVDKRIKAFYSLSLFGPGAKRLGFTLHEVPQTFKVRRIALWMSILRKVFAPEFTNKAKKHRKHVMPCEIWISREQLKNLS